MKSSLQTRPMTQPHVEAWTQRRHGSGGSTNSWLERSGRIPHRHGASQPELAGGTSIVHDVLRSAGQPLDVPTRTFFESRFEHDFGGVRIHTDEMGARSARAVNATAYTVGNHVVFGSAQYRPGSSGTQKLLAHELAHTVQQSGPVRTPEQLQISKPEDAWEVEAEQVSDACMAGQPLSLNARVGINLSRQQAHVETPEEKKKREQEEFRKQLQSLSQGPSGSPSGETPEAAAERMKKEQLLESAKSKGYGRSPSGAQSTWGWGSPETNNLNQECKVTGMERSDFLSFYGALWKTPAAPKRKAPGSPQIALGATQLHGTIVPPEIAAVAVPGGFKLKPTHAEMPTVYAAFTQANERGFDEGTRQCGDLDCAAERKKLGTSKFPIHWTITPGGAQRLEAGEREHCEDYRNTFRLTLALYASVINNLAAAERVYRTEKDAIDEGIRNVGVKPDQMVGKFIQMAGLSEQRDLKGWHTTNDSLPEKDFHSQKCSIANGCKAIEIIDEKSLPGVDAKHPFEELASSPQAATKKGAP